MSAFIGQQYLIGIAKETTRGTAVDPSTGDWIGWASLKVDRKKETTDIETAIGRITTLQDKKLTKYTTEISITVPLDRKLLKTILEAIYGQVSTSADDPEAGVNTHTFSVLQSNIQYPTYTLTVISGDVQQYQIPFCALKKVSIPLKVGETPMVTLEFIGNMYSEVTGKTASYLTDNSIFSPLTGKVYLADDYASLDTVSDVCVQDANIDITRDVEAIYCVGSTEYRDVVTTAWNIEMKVTKVYDDTDELTRFINNSSVAARLKFIDTNVTLGTATNPTFQVDIPNGKYTERSETVELKKIVGEEITITGLDDTTNNISVAKLITDV